MQNELYHYGIQGMKWGVRRYQNPDGTLTAEGRNRYGVQVGTGVTNFRKGTNASVDVAIAKNSATRRVAEDYHKLNDKEFMRKYQTTKNKFAKRYQRSKGDTYNMGKRGQAAAVSFIDAVIKRKNAYRTVKDVLKYNRLSDQEQRALDRGDEFAAGYIRSMVDVELNKLRKLK